MADDAFFDSIKTNWSFAPLEMNAPLSPWWADAKPLPERSGPSAASGSGEAAGPGNTDTPRA